MHDLDIELGQEYVYDGQLVKAVGTRVICKANRERDDETFVTIEHKDGTRHVVKPHEIQEVPTNVDTWNVLIERPIGFRRLP